jgi:beta-galactosidase
LAQIENEYGNGGSDPKRVDYIQWCGNLTVELDIDVPWIMCQQPDAPKPTIYACNGFYCDWYVAAQQTGRQQPAMWTENWPGWFQDHGQAKPRRPAEDVAYAMMHFVAAGGAFHKSTQHTHTHAQAAGDTG